MCRSRFCPHRQRFKDMNSISEEREDDTPNSTGAEEEAILDSLPPAMQVYLTSPLSADRTNQMTKTHNDLDAILQLLQEKEKDLELAARIGQSLLERNKNLMHKTEVMEKYLGEHSDREEQLRHDIVRKNDLLQKFLKDQEDMFLEADNKLEEEARSSDNASLQRDDSFNTLQDKCQVLEQQNTRFILEALSIKEQTASEEQRERQLVADCVHQLIEAKDQITALTDDIAQKAEDNVRQQEEISQLITTVVELQKRHSQLSMDNEELQSLLNVSQAGQDELKTQIADLQDKYHECFEILMENQQEMRSLNQKIETPRPKKSPSSTNVGARDSIAREIEQSVKRDLADIQEKRQNLARVLQTVRNINVAKGKTKVKKSSKQSSSGSSTSGFKFNPATDIPRTTSDASIDGDDSSSTSGLDSRHSYGRRSFRKPEKLQIVKPIKGSATLQQWKKLASPSMKLEEQRPGVHVKGESPSPHDGRLSKEQSDVSDVDDVEEDEPIQIKIRSKPKETASVNKEGKPTHTTQGISLALASLGIQAQSQDSTSSSILAQLLNSPSATTPGRSSVGQVLAEVLQKASQEASSKEPKRAESLRNLANYFSEKEKAGKAEPEPIPEDDSPPVSPPIYKPLDLPSTGGLGGVGGMSGSSILSRMLAGSSGIGVSLPSPRPIATIAGSSSTATTTSSTSLLSQTGFGRTSSGTDLKRLDTSHLNPPEKRLSLDATNLISAVGSFNTNDTTTTSLPTLRRRASSGDLESMSSNNDLSGSVNNIGLGARLYRSSSSGSLNDLSQTAEASAVNPGGFFGRLTRRPSLGSLTDLVQKSNFGTVPIPPQGKMERASSIDSSMVSRPGQSPPSPSHFDTNRSFFQTKNEPSKGFFSGPKLSSLAGVRGIWSQGPSSTSQGDLPQAPPTQKSEERLEKINKAFAFEDFGGMGLMSFFGSKKSGQNN